MDQHVVQESSTFYSHSQLYTDIGNIFTTPTTVSEASDDAKEIALEEDLLSYCKDKERFLSIVYHLKDKKLEIFVPYLKLLSLFKEDKPTSCEEVSDNSPTDSKGSKTPPTHWEVVTPQYLDWDFAGSFDGLSIEPGIPEREEEQECVLTEDMLNILLGYDGKYIKANVLKASNDIRTFRISPHIRPSLRGLVEKILPVASDYSTLVRFVNENTAFAAGKVNQALAAAFSDELLEYMNDVLQLEHQKETQNFTLHIAWFALQDTMNRMRIMGKIAEYINRESARGAATLSILHRCTSNSLADPEAEKVCLKLTKAACAPYFEILGHWIYKGHIDDPFDEFMVVKKNVKMSNDWEHKFELRPKNVPSFLKLDDKLILNAGRYMYAVRKSISRLQPSPCAEMEHMQYESIELIYLNIIRRAYNFANETLLSMLEDETMLRWLSTAKSFFSLEFDDVFYNIMHNCCDVLEKPMKHAYVPQLQKLIVMSIQSSSISKLPFTEDYTVKLEKFSLMRQVLSLNIQTTNDYSSSNVLEALTFVINPPWPICIIFHSKTLTGYQMIFRHIFYLKYVYMKLTSTRLIDKPKSYHLLKYSMTVFVLTCLSYMTVDTIQTLWDKFETEFRCADSVIELMQQHNSYIYQALLGCMLASSEVFQHLRKILSICLDFCNQIDIGLEEEFKQCMVVLIKVTSKEPCWSSFIKMLIPTFTDIPEVVKLNNLCLY